MRNVDRTVRTKSRVTRVMFLSRKIFVGGVANTWEVVARFLGPVPHAGELQAIAKAVAPLRRHPQAVAHYLRNVPAAGQLDQPVQRGVLEQGRRRWQGCGRRRC